MRYIGAGLLTIGAVIFFLGFRAENYNLYFLAVGGLIALIGFVSMVLIDKKAERLAIDDYNIWKEKLIRDGIKTEVDLNKVEIKSTIYREEIVREGYAEMDKYKALGTLIGEDNRDYSEIKQSVILCEVDVLGKKRKFYSPVIPKDEITLQFLLNDQKKTFIYSDRLNEDHYFFDLEFLND